MEAKQSGVRSILSALWQDAGSCTAFPLPGSPVPRAVLLRECKFSAGRPVLNSYGPQAQRGLCLGNTARSMVEAGLLA